MSKRKVIQLVSFSLFIFLLIINKAQLWIVIFIGSVFLSIFFGRFYCGYLCPINTPIEILAKSRGNKNTKKIPEWVKSPVIRYSIILFFIAVFIIMRMTDKQLPLMPVLMIIAILLSIVYSPLLWHKYLCPFGTILSTVSKVKKGLIQTKEHR